MKASHIFILFTLFLFSWNKYDDVIADLQKQIDDLQAQVDANTANYNALKEAFEANMHILSITETDTKWKIH